MSIDIAPNPTKQYVLLQGGLGNQLFIVAAMYALHESHERHHERHHESHSIELLFSPQTNMHLQYVTRRASYEKTILKWLPRFDTDTYHAITRGVHRLPIRNEPPRPPLTAPPHGQSYIWMGYFQHTDFVTPLPTTFRNAMVDQFREYQSTYHSSIRPNCIGLHIRRTDYCQLGHIYVQLTVTYYERAVRHLLPHLSQSNFDVYVCSDSISDAHHVLDGLWKKLEDEGYHPTVIYGQSIHNRQTDNNNDDDNGEDRDLQDFFGLMECPHVVTANSTFSWWAAVLHHEVHERGTTICPRRWFNDRQTPPLTVNVPVGHEWIDLDV